MRLWQDLRNDTAGQQNTGRGLVIKVETLAQLYLLKSYPLSMGTIKNDITGQDGVGDRAIRQLKGDTV